MVLNHYIFQTFPIITDPLLKKELKRMKKNYCIFSVYVCIVRIIHNLVQVSERYNFIHFTDFLNHNSFANIDQN